MAGSSMTFAYEDLYNVRRIVIDWVSDDALGTVSGTTAHRIAGYLLKGVTDPDGTAAPDDNYNIVLTDEEGANILANCFDDLLLRDTANVESVDFHLYDGAVGNGARPCVCDKITVSVSAAGNSKAGRLILYWIGG